MGTRSPLRAALIGCGHISVRHLPAWQASPDADLVVRMRRPHAGVILFRLGATDLATKIQRLDDVLRECADRLDQFIVVTLQSIRVRV